MAESGGQALSARLRGDERIRWDEETIAAHDKERGTRRKIIEPKTPYRPFHDFSSRGSVGSVASDDMQPDATTEGRLRAAFSQRDGSAAAGWESGSETGSHLGDWEAAERDIEIGDGDRDGDDGMGDTTPSPRERGAADAARAEAGHGSGNSRSMRRARSRDSSDGGRGYYSDASVSSGGSRGSSASSRRRRVVEGVSSLHAHFADAVVLTTAQLEAAPEVNAAETVAVEGDAAGAGAPAGIAFFQPDAASASASAIAGGGVAVAVAGPEGGSATVPPAFRAKRAHHYGGEGLLLRHALALARAAADDEEEEVGEGEDQDMG